MEVTNGMTDSAHYGPIGDAARKIASYCEGDARSHVYAAAFTALTTATAEADALRAEVEALRAALGNLIAACDEGRTVHKGGACGMTIEAQIRASVINGVPAWPVEEARTALERQP